MDYSIKEKIILETIVDGEPKKLEIKGHLKKQGLIDGKPYLIVTKDTSAHPNWSKSVFAGHISQWHKRIIKDWEYNEGLLTLVSDRRSCDDKQRLIWQKNGYVSSSLEHNGIKEVIVNVLDNDVLYIGKNSSEAAVYSFTQKKRISEFSSDAHNLVANEKTFAYVAIDHHRYGLSHRISSTKKISIDFEMAGHLLIRDSDIFSTAHDGEDGWIVVNHEKKHKCTGAHTLKQKDGIVYGFINGIGLSRNFWIDKTNEVQTGPLIRTKEPYVIIEDDKPQYLAKSLFGRQILVHGETKKKSN